MALRNTQALRFQALGVTDAIDGTNAAPGSMAVLQDLVPNPSTSETFVPRPAATSVTSFAGFTTPLAVSALIVIGTRAYGMIASGRFAGHDEPFCYDLALGAFVTISGVTSANTPLTPATSGDWTPPQLDMISTKLIVTHPGFTGVPNFFGWFDLSVPATPSWNAGNTTGGLALPFPPIAVQQFNGRAYYAVRNSLVFSDSLNPTVVTNATQVLILGDTTPITALGGLPLANQVVGGIIQSVIAFKGSQSYFQITGDASTSDLKLNVVAGSVGTVAPNSIAATPVGLAYIAPDGLRLVGLDGKSSDPIGVDGSGISLPFIYAVNPTRIAAAYNENVLRVTSQNGSINGEPTQEWWFHLTRKAWTGPHSFPCAMISPYQNGALNTFICAGIGINGKLWQSDAVPGLNSTYIENGVPLTWAWQTSLQPDNGLAAMNNIIESTHAFAIPVAQFVTTLALDEEGNLLGTVVLGSALGGGTIWGSFTWGGFPWGANVMALRQYRHAWPNPLTFKQMALRATGNSTAGFIVGNLYAKYQPLGYML